MKKYFAFFFTLLLCGPGSFSYAGNTVRVVIPGNAPTAFKLPANVKEGDYLPNTLLFKVKPLFRQNCKLNSIDNLLPLQDFLLRAGAKNLAKIFPHHSAPEREVNPFGQKLTDLSTLYSFQYSSSLSLEKMINSMLSLGYFEYVEPWYVPKIDLVCVANDTSAVQYHLRGNVTGSINVLNTAWCVSNGDTNIVIGIVDTGTQLDHPDLKANVKLNYADPIDGVDNDGDGYTDNFHGWDLGMNDNDPTWQGNFHGCATSGDACAVTNNSTGVASPGFNCKFLPVKGADNNGILVAVYPGIVYAADHGATIISNSYGGPGGGLFGQDIIDYATINKNCLVLASAGNNGVEDKSYPSSYNGVYRVAATTSTDTRAIFSSFGLDVDYAAPGNNIYSTMSNSGYAALSGTSMSCPVSAGAAGLIQSIFHYTNAFQIGERLKQTCDSLTKGDASTTSLYNAGKLGKGRINVGNALSSVTSKSILLNPVTITDGNDNVFMPGENLSLSGLFTNYLDSCSSAATAVLSVGTGAAYATVTNGTFTIGALATLGTTKNTASPFTITIGANAPVNQLLRCKVHITDGNFQSDQYFDITVNVDYINVTINDVHTTITSKGRIGYNADAQAQGLGFEYQWPTPTALLYEMSLMIGTSSTQVSDMFRETTTGNNDFGPVKRVSELNTNTATDFGADGKFNDAPSASSPLPVEVHHSAYAWAATPYRKFVTVKYVIKNTGTVTLSNLYAGIIADWDVPNANSGQDKAEYDSTSKMGYVYFVDSTLKRGPYAAIKLLSSTAPANNYVIDNVTGGNNGVDASNFSTASKYLVLSTPRNSDKFPKTGGDVMDCVSSGPFTVPANDSVEVAFALIAGDDLVDIQGSACAAQTKYDNGCANAGVNDPEKDNFWMYGYPNPASNSFSINYNVVGYNKASIRIMNSLGEVVMSYENLAQGKNTLKVDAGKFSSGNYFYQLRSGEDMVTKKMAIVK
jgi:serine protease